MVEDQILLVEDEFDWGEVTHKGRLKGLVVVHPGSDLTGLRCERLIVSRGVSGDYEEAEWYQNIVREVLVPDGEVVVV